MKDKLFEKFKDIKDKPSNENEINKSYDADKSTIKKKRELIDVSEFLGKEVSELAQTIVFLRLENEMLKRKIEGLTSNQ